MKIPTIPGKYYIVRSSIGCTVTQEGANGQTLANAVPADEDTPVFAHSGKFQISDDNATITEVFKLAPVAFGGGGAQGWYDVLKSELRELLGAGNFTLSYAWVDGAAVLTLALADGVTVEQATQAEALLRRYKPSALQAVLQPLPIGFTLIDYIENLNGGDNNAGYGPAASIRTDIYPTQNTRARIVAEAVSVDRNDMYFAFGCAGGVNQEQPFGCNWFNRYHKNEANFSINEGGLGTSTPFYTMSDGVAHTLELSKENCKIDGVEKYRFGDIGEFKSPQKLMFLSETPNNVKMRCFRGKAYSFQLWEDDVPILNFIPALDAAGAPCMFDTVTRKAYYSVTGYDFTYPGAEEAPAATTYSLRAPRPYRPDFAKDTGRGIARVYRVPAGYEGSVEEYAAAQGYKWLVENEQPAEGDWQPVWRETEEQLILDWVETEAPTEEETLTETE